MMRSRRRRSNGWIAAIKRASEFHFISLELTKLQKRLGGILITLSYTSEYANYFQFFSSSSSSVTLQSKSVNLVLVLLITHLVASTLCCVGPSSSQHKIDCSSVCEWGPWLKLATDTNRLWGHIHVLTHHLSEDETSSSGIWMLMKEIRIKHSSGAIQGNHNSGDQKEPRTSGAMILPIIRISHCHPLVAGRGTEEEQEELRIHCKTWRGGGKKMSWMMRWGPGDEWQRGQT